MAWAAESITRSDALRLPFGTGRTSPVAARDVAEVVAAILLDPAPYVGQVLELTGPHSAALDALVDEYAAALGRPIRYQPISLDDWGKAELKKRGLPDHLYQHLMTMAELHAANRYDRHTDTVERVLHRPPTSLRDTVCENRQLFQSRLNPSRPT
jgi:uncharacterized protein YbjT (DUF2867 family)